MKKLLAGFAVATVALLFASQAFAVAKFPPGPLGTCTDTMSINTLKTYLNTSTTPCNATTPNTTGGVGDTVLGIGGIITGFDEIATGYDCYIQTSGGGTNTGIDVFTHGINMRPVYGFNRGDSIIVEYACVANFNGDVEVESPNNNFGAPNIILRKVSSGNALPPFLHGNTTDFLTLSTNAYFKSHMSELVTLDGPVRVARTGAGLGTRGALAVRDAAPSDSVYIDYNKLTTIVPPAVGTYLTSVSGISNATSGVYNLRIMPRDGNDIVDAQPPAVTDAYAIADNQYRVVFDRNVTTASATDPTNYTTGSFTPVNSVVMDGTSAVILNVDPVTHGTHESVTALGVVGSANGIAITTGVAQNFIAGLLTVGEMSSPSPDSLAKIPCQDKSIYAGGLGDYTNGLGGPRSTFGGIITGLFGSLYYSQDGTDLTPGVDQLKGIHRGITVFAPPVGLTLGHRYAIAGADEEYYKENEFAFITYVLDLGASTIPPAIKLPVGLANYDTCDANQNILDGKDYLSLLVELDTVKVVQRFATLPTNGFHVAGPYPACTDTIFIENVSNVLGTNSSSNPNYPAVGKLVNIVGMEHYTTNTSSPSCRVAPRTPADITILGTAGVTPSTRSLSFSVFPNPARTVNIAFSLPTATHVTIGIYDLLGRQVATIANGEMAAGAYTRSWNGLDASGNRVNSGVYFYRMRAGNQVRTARTMLVNN